MYLLFYWNIPLYKRWWVTEKHLSWFKLSSLVTFVGVVSSFEPDTAWNRVIPFKILKWLIKFYISCLTLRVFHYLLKYSIKDFFCWYAGQNCGLGVKYILKQGNPMNFFVSVNRLYFYCFIFYFFRYLIKRLSKVRPLWIWWYFLCWSLRKAQNKTGELLAKFWSH